MPDDAGDSVERLLDQWRREQPGLDPWPVAVFARLLRSGSRLQRRTEAWLAEEGLTWEAFSLVVTLRRQGEPYELRPTDILRESLLTSGAVTNRIDRVERLGLVERRPDPTDRRAIVVRLTTAGIASADRVMARHVEHLATALDDMPEEDRATLIRLLAGLLARLEGADARQPP